MLQIVVIGAGARSNTYLKYILENPETGKVVAIAEPNDQRRANFASKFNVPPDRCYRSWEDILSLESKLGDLIIIGTLDRLHYEPTVAACKLGYNIILEKPMGVTLDQCLGIYNAVKENNVKLYVCHVMRYHPLYRKAKEILASGVLGKIKSVRWLQPINIIHFVKSYVRHPEWSRKELSGPLTLTKACHDLDLIYWMLGATQASVDYAIGDRTEFIPENAPSEAGNFCTQCPLKQTCRYSALENYGTYPRYRKYVSNRLNATREEAIEDLTVGPYDRCAWKTDANVMEQYEILIKMYANENPINVNMTISAYHDDICCRTATFIGTHGRLEIDEANQICTVVYGTKSNGELGEKVVYDCNDQLPSNTRMTGHSGADYHFMHELMSGVNLTPPEESLASHILAFDIENARIQGKNWKG